MRKRRLSKISNLRYRVCDECDFLMDNCNFFRMIDSRHGKKLEEHEEVKDRLKASEKQVKKIERELKSQQKLIGKSKAQTETKHSVRDNLMAERQNEVNELIQQKDKL